MIMMNNDNQEMIKKDKDVHCTYMYTYMKIHIYSYKHMDIYIMWYSISLNISNSEQGLYFSLRAISVRGNSRIFYSNYAMSKKSGNHD